DDRCALSQIIEAQIKEAGALPIDDCNAKSGLGPKQGGQRLQLKTGLEINAGRSKTRGQIVFPPEVLSRAGEHCPAPRLAAQVGRKLEHAIEVGMQRSVLTLRSGTLQRLLYHIFCDDGLAAM